MKERKKAFFPALAPCTKGEKRKKTVRKKEERKLPDNTRVQALSHKAQNLTLLHQQHQ
jgi:hypothetical protein